MFVGGFTLDTAEWPVASDRRGSADAIDALAVLTDNNLVTRADNSADGAIDASLKRTGQHLGGASREMHVRTVATSRSAIGADAFAAARERGRASDYDAWILSGEAIVRMAAAREFGDGDDRPIANLEARPPNRAQLAASQERWTVPRSPGVTEPRPPPRHDKRPKRWRRYGCAG